MTIDDLVKQRLEQLDQFSEKRGLAFPGRRAKGFSPEAWFLGPKAENLPLLKRLIGAALDAHARHRRVFHPEDPRVINPREKGYREAVSAFEREARELFEVLSWSVPVSSMRHQGHMLWDQVMPAVVGYFAAMVYNQNNVAAESSSVTTLLEISVADDLCAMLGFKPRDLPGHPAEKIQPWGHITCGGSVANIEALWAARNAKYFPAAVRAAVAPGGPLHARAGALAVGDRPLADLNDWQVLNVSADDAVNLIRRLELEHRVKWAELEEVLKEFALPKLGWLDFARKFPTLTARSPRVLCPGTRHYSWPKGATLLGLGDQAIESIAIDQEARLDVRALRAKLDECLADHVPVIAVVAVIGTTAESAVDPLAAILKARDEYRSKGLDFAVHCDAAWGGYFAAMLRDADVPPPRGVSLPAVSARMALLDPNRARAAAAADVPPLPMSSHVSKQYQALGGADSITVDPHKAGYVPYPAGALCYANAAMRDMVSLAAPVVYHSQTEPTVGIYGIEGSKPGAAAAATWLAHRVVRTTSAGYGQILERCMWTAMRLYCRLVTLDLRYPKLGIKLVPLVRLPLGQRPGITAQEILQERRRLSEAVDLPNKEFEKLPGIHE